MFGVNMSDNIFAIKLNHYCINISAKYNQLTRLYSWMVYHAKMCVCIFYKQEM